MATLRARATPRDLRAGHGRTWTRRCGDRGGGRLRRPAAWGIRRPREAGKPATVREDDVGAGKKDCHDSPRWRRHHPSGPSTRCSTGSPTRGRSRRRPAGRSRRQTRRGTNRARHERTTAAGRAGRPVAGDGQAGQPPMLDWSPTTNRSSTASPTRSTDSISSPRPVGADPVGPLRSEIPDVIAVVPVGRPCPR